MSRRNVAPGSEKQILMMIAKQLTHTLPIIINALKKIDALQDTSNKSPIKENQFTTFSKMFPEEKTSNKEFIRALKLFYKHRKEKQHGKQLTSNTMKLIVNKLQLYSVEESIIALNYAVESGWTSVYPKSIYELRKVKPTNTCGSRNFVKGTTKYAENSIPLYMQREKEELAKKGK